MAERLDETCLSNGRGYGKKAIGPSRKFPQDAPSRQVKSRMTNEKFLFPGPGVHGLFKELAKLFLKGRNGNPCRMAAAANKDPRHDGKGKENNEGRQRKWAVKKRPDP